MKSDNSTMTDWKNNRLFSIRIFSHCLKLAKQIVWSQLFHWMNWLWWQLILIIRVGQTTSSFQLFESSLIWFRWRGNSICSEVRNILWYAISKFLF